jgi:hypothetical protein
MSIGYEDPTAKYVRTGREPLRTTVTFVEE